MAGGDDFADGGGSLDIGGLDEGDAGDAGSHNPAAFPTFGGIGCPKSRASRGAPSVRIHTDSRRSDGLMVAVTRHEVCVAYSE